MEEDLPKLLSHEEIYWRQHSKQLWLQEGDLNTKYFHRFANHRRRTNHLFRIQDQLGEWVEGETMHVEVIWIISSLFFNPMVVTQILREGSRLKSRTK